MENNHIQYIEFYATDLKRIKQFYVSAFGWKFTDYGETYTSFSGAGVDGGFEKSETVKTGGPLVILYHTDLGRAQTAIEDAGGEITKPIFAFPGGERFHFIDPAGNQLAVWRATGE